MSTCEEAGGVTTKQVLRLHVDGDGQVWYGADGFLGGGSGRLVETFLDQAADLGIALDSACCVRLLGARCNSELITRLYERHAAYRARVRLCNPAVCPTRFDRVHPTVVLQALWQMPLAAGVSSHPMAASDFGTHAIICELRRQKAVSEKARRIACYHPAWRALSFLPTLAPDAAVRLLADVVDPRWFRHPFRPHRATRLAAYLGLTPQNINCFLEGREGGLHFDRAHNVIDCWYNPGGFRTLPGNFLFRVLARHPDLAHGLLHACQRFVRFVSQVWLAEVEVRRPEGGFLDSAFFKDEGELRAYRAHRAVCDRV